MISKRTGIRLVAVLSLIVLCVYLAFIGKEHRVFFDNRVKTIDGVKYKSEYTYEVAVLGTGEEPEFVDLDDMTMIEAVGPKHVIEISVMDLDGEPLYEISRNVSMGFKTDCVLYLPLIVDTHMGEKD
ncbi:MAG: DUF6672 family protein [Thermovirgaceae bacterium]|jgi:hypothetical protein